MAKKFVRIIEDIEEALARDVRKILFHTQRDRAAEELIFKEMFNPFTGELVKKPIEPRFYDDTAEALGSSSPRFTLQLLKLYEDLETSRALPAIGLEQVELLPSPKAYDIIFGGMEAITTDGGTTSDILLNNLKIRNLTTDHWIRITSGNNKGTYRIETITLNGNGPHTITLNNDLLIDLPAFKYNPQTGLLTFNEYVDLQAIKIGDNLVDVNSNSFAITALDTTNATLTIAVASAIVSSLGASINRIGDVLTEDDEGDPQCYLILDPDAPITNKGTEYRLRSQLIPYSFLYYIKIVSKERDDHIAIAGRMMEVFNPPRGVLYTITRFDESSQSDLIKNALVGETVLYLKDASKFYVNEHIRLFDNLGIGEDLVIEQVNLTSNTLIVSTPILKNYKIDDSVLVVSNYQICTLERDFKNHTTEDQVDKQLWVHRFTYKVEGWIESRITPYTTEQTFQDVGDVNFINAVLEDFDGNQIGEISVP